MRSVTYYIHEKRYVYYSFHADNGRIRASTGVVTTKDGDITAISKADKNKLSRLETEVDKYVASCRMAVQEVTKDAVRLIVNNEIGRSTAVSGKSILDLVTEYRNQALAGKILNSKGTRHSQATLDLYGTIIMVLSSDLLGRLPINKLSELHIKDFQARMSTIYIRGNSKNGKLSKNTIATYNNGLMSVISATYSLGWHKNRVALDNKMTVAPESIDYAIYYSVEELRKLYNHDFKESKFNALRDVFVFGCFTCLRHSDYYQTDYQKAVNGAELIVKLQKKGNQVKIPLHPIAIKILGKYGYKLPKIPLYLFDRQIKKMCQMAGFNEPVLFSRTHGGKLKKEYKQKWELTTTHTMRRSFATNSLKAGMNEWVVMAIGGWRSESAFKKYKRMSEDDVSINAMNSDFYKVAL